MDLYDTLKGNLASQLDEMVLRLEIDAAHVRCESVATRATDLAKLAQADPALAERMWSLLRSGPSGRVRVGLVAVAAELAVAAEEVEALLRRRPQVCDVLRIEPGSDDAKERLATCGLVVVLVGVAVGGDAGFALLQELVCEDRTVAVRRFPPEEEAMEAFAEELGLSSRLMKLVSTKFDGDGAADVLRSEIARRLEVLVPVEAGSSAAPSAFEEDYLRRSLPKWLMGHHEALVERANRRTLERAALYVPLNADSGTVFRLDGALVLGAAGPHRALAEGSTRESVQAASTSAASMDAALGLPEMRVCLVVGDAGTGKTVLVQHLAATLALHHLQGSLDPEWAMCAGHVQAAAHEVDLAGLAQEAPLLPIPVVVEARELATELRGGPGAVVRLMENRLTGAAEGEVAQGLARGRYWLLVDSLDEVPSQAARRSVLQALAGVAGAGRLLLSSRPGAHTAVDVPPVFARLPIAPLDNDLREQMIARWAAAQGFGEEEHEALGDAIRDLRDRFVSLDGDRPIEDNPLLLTCTFLVFQEKRRLPDNTADLYKRMLEILCETRKAGEVEVSGGPEEPHAARVASANVRLGRGRALAMALQQRKTTVVPRRDLAQDLLSESVLGLRTVDEAEALISTLCASTAIFREEDADGGSVVRPWHRSFQEYLAASHLAERDGAVADLVNELVADGRMLDPSWHGALAFVVGALGQFGAARAQAAVTQLMARTQGAEPVLAGRLYAVAAAGAAEYREESFQGQEELLEALAREGLRAFADHGTHWGWRDRVAFLDAVGALGLDDRFADPLTDPSGWVELPVWSGEVGAKKGGTFGALTPRQVSVPRLFVMHRPVTVADYAPFIDSTGRKAPSRWGSQLRSPQRPVWGVDWEDALTFCAWATQTWLLPEPGTVDLPTSTEWESVARRQGGAAFPWGDAEPSQAHASFAFDGQDSPRHVTPVGAFPLGSVRRGNGRLDDLSGNLWEWTRTVWVNEDEESDVVEVTDDVALATEPEALRGAPRVVRGGSWNNPSRLLRCSTRLRDHPEVRLHDLGFRVVLRPDSSG